MTVLQLNPIPGKSEAAPAAATKPPAGSTVVDIVTKALNSGADVTALTALYLKLRNAKKDLDEQAKAKTGPINQSMDMIEAHFLAKMNELKVDSLKNESGTPYRAQSVSVTVADNAAFLDFVLTRALSAIPNLSDAARDAVKNAMVESGQFALVEARASKSAVEAYLEETKELPPGLNRRVEDKVNIRAS